MQLQRLLALTRTAYGFSSSAQIPTNFLRLMGTMPQASKKQKVEAAAAIEKSLPAADVDVAEFDSIVQELKTYDERREIVIKRSRDIQKASKQAIFSLHRNAVQEAQQRLNAAATAAADILPLIEEMPTLRGGSYSNAVEEYAEAVCFLTYLREGRLPSRSEVKLAETEEWLGGILDFTGELNRVAVARATVRDKEAVQRARDLVEALQGQFLRFDLRNGALRKKYDALKYTMRKMEQILYELSLTEAGLATKPEEVPEGMDVGKADVADADV